METLLMAVCLLIALTIVVTTQKPPVVFYSMDNVSGVNDVLVDDFDDAKEEEVTEEPINFESYNKAVDSIQSMFTQYNGSDKRERLIELLCEISEEYDTSELIEGDIHKFIFSSA